MVAPEVPVTVTLNVPRGVPVGGGGVVLPPPPPPHDALVPIATRMAASAKAVRHARCCRAARAANANAAASSSMGQRIRGCGAGKRGVVGGASAPAVVVMVRVDVTAAAAPVIGVGLNAQALCAGNPAQVSATWPVNPPSEVSVMVDVPEPPRVTVMVVGFAASEKSGG